MGEVSTYDSSYNGLFVEYLKFQNDDMQPMKSKHYHDFFEIYYYLGNNMNDLSAIKIMLWAKTIFAYRQMWGSIKPHTT